MLSRKEAIKIIMENIKENDIIISSTGITSRELYYVKDRNLNWYTMGSLGITISISLGIALNCDRKVTAIIGDGDCLMELGSLVTINKFRPKNLQIYVLNNNEHASTGGQITSSNYVRFQDLAPYNVINVPIDKGKGNAGRIPLTGKQIKERFLEALND